MSSEMYWVGLNELKAALKKSPENVLNKARVFLVRGLAAYKSGIVGNPWRIGTLSGGGSPVSNDPRYPRQYQRQRSGNLRDTHITHISGLEATLGPNTQAAPYARYVHHGTRNMQGRPWLDYVKRAKQGEIERLYRQMLKDIVGDLAR